MLFPEMAATVHFLGEGKPNPTGPVVPQVTAPAAAVQTDGGGAFVWKVVEDRVQRVSIEAGGDQRRPRACAAQSQGG